MSRPIPLLDKDVDLRDFPFMPVEITRLLGSDFNAIGDDTAWRVGFVLWLRSYQQVPAGSLPSDDAAIMRLAELGKDAKTWKRIKADALRGWVECDDGRLYHPVVCEKALEGWIEKLAQKKLSDSGNAKRYGLPFDPAPLDAAMERTKAQLQKLNPRSRALNKKGKRYAPGAPAGTPDLNTGPPDGSPLGTDLPPSLDSQEKRQRQGRDTLPEEGDAWVGVRERVAAAFAKAGSPNTPDTSHVDVWRSWGYDPAICVAVVTEIVTRKPSISRLTYFDQAIADRHAMPVAQARDGPRRSASHDGRHDVLAELRAAKDGKRGHQDEAGRPAGEPNRSAVPRLERVP